MAFNNNSTQGNYQLIDNAQYQDMIRRAEQQAKDTARPDRPAWESMLGDDGLIKAPYQATDAYNRDALGQMRQDLGRAPGEQSRWRQLQEAKLGNVNAQAQGQTQAGMNQLAMKGGLRGGASERMVTAGSRNALMAGQDARLKLDMADEQNRLKGLGVLNQAELQNAQQTQGVQGANIKASLNDIFQKRYADQSAYKEELAAWGSERTAAATPSGGGKK